MLSVEEERLINTLGIERYTDESNNTKFVMKYYTADADSEEPDCGRCDNVLSDLKCINCGPACFWNNYQRTVCDILTEEDLHKLYNRIERLEKVLHRN